MATSIKTLTRWDVERSHLFNPPDFIMARDVADLRKKIQKLADNKPARAGVPPMGKIEFRYEMTESHDDFVVVHSYFINKHGHKARFMRLRRAA